MCCGDIFEGTFPPYPVAYLFNFIDKSTMHVYLILDYLFHIYDHKICYFARKNRTALLFFKVTIHELYTSTGSTSRSNSLQLEQGFRREFIWNFCRTTTSIMDLLLLQSLHGNNENIL
jgi:hypothetical protein